MLVNNLNFLDKFYNNLLTIKDQKEALTDSYKSYYFARANIPGSDIKALQAKACENSYCAYRFAKYIANANIKYCQEHACKAPNWAYYFAIDIPNSDKEYCFKHAFPDYAYDKDYWKAEYKKFIMKKACE